jgi:hypothetical protein
VVFISFKPLGDKGFMEEFFFYVALWNKMIDHPEILQNSYGKAQSTGILEEI